MSEWQGYILEDYVLEFPAGARVLDVGCGVGEQLSELRAYGAAVFGLDLDLASLKQCRGQGLSVTAGQAENLPFDDSSIDGILCKVALSYTDDRKALAEFARVLRPGGTAYIITHGAGYYLEYLLKSRSFATRVYGLRSLVNTFALSLAKKRLPGFLGDTIYQSEKRLATIYAKVGFQLQSERTTHGPLGKPVFIYHRVAKVG